jgi:ribosomal protein L37E
MPAGPGVFAMSHKMNPESGKCTACGHHQSLHAEQKRCEHCLPVFIPSYGRRKLARALLILFLVFIISLVLEGLWATGVITPHSWFRSSCVKKIAPATGIHIPDTVKTGIRRFGRA